MSFSSVGTILMMVLPQVKGLSTEELTARNDLALALPDRIQAIPDGGAAPPKQSGGWGASASRTEIKFDSGNVCTFFKLSSQCIFLLLPKPKKIFSYMNHFGLQMAGLIVNIFSKVKSQVNSSKSMRCGK